MLFFARVKVYKQIHEARRDLCSEAGKKVKDRSPAEVLSS